MARNLNSKAAMRGGRSVGPKNAPAPYIPRPQIGGEHGTTPKQQGTKPKPEMLPQQLNPLSKVYGQPQYGDETPIPGDHLRALIAHLKQS